MLLVAGSHHGRIFVQPMMLLPPGHVAAQAENVPADRINGLRVTQLGNRSYGESVREEGSGPDKRYRISRNRPIGSGSPDGTDIWALKNNYVSVTPLQIGLVNHREAPEVEDLLAGISGLSLGSQA